MKNIEDAKEELGKLSKSYDNFFAKLNDANKTSMPVLYTKGIHVKKCREFFFHYVKSQTSLIRWGIYIVTPLIAILYPFLKEGTTWLNNISNLAYYGFGVLGLFLLFSMLFGWINRNTLLGVTEPTNDLFHIGAYEKYRNQEYKRNYDFFKDTAFSFDSLKYIVEDGNKSHQLTKDYYQNKLHRKDDLLTKSITKFEKNMDSFAHYSIGNHKLEQLVEETLSRLSDLTRNRLDYGNLDFLYFYTIHQPKKYKYRIVDWNHYDEDVNQNILKNRDSPLKKLEETTEDFLIHENTILFKVNKKGDRSLLVTLYPKTKPYEELQSETNYDNMYMKKVISFWRSFIPLIELTKVKKKGDAGYED